MAKIGRPSTYSNKIVTQLCKYLTQGMSLKTACKQKGMPNVATVFDWLRIHKEFNDLYAQAKQESADALAEEILEISDEAHRVVNKGSAKKANAFAQVEKLRVDTRKWIMARMKPKKYGERLDLTSGGDKLPTPIYGSNSIKRKPDSAAK